MLATNRVFWLSMPALTLAVHGVEVERVTKSALVVTLDPETNISKVCYKQ